MTFLNLLLVFIIAVLLAMFSDALQDIFYEYVIVSARPYSQFYIPRYETGTCVNDMYHEYFLEALYDSTHNNSPQFEKIDYDGY